MCCIGAVAQTNETLTCPTILLNGPSGFPIPDELIKYSVSLSEDAKNFDLKYVWTVSGGEILEGQGTPFIKTTCQN